MGAELVDRSTGRVSPWYEVRVITGPAVYVLRAAVAARGLHP